MEKSIVRRERIADDFLPDSLHPTIKQIYAARGITAEQQLQLTVNQLADIDSLLGLPAACQCIYQALSQQQKITIIGDFDADGATSTALMMEALTLFGSSNHDFLVPNRFKYGYGLTPEIVDVAHQQGTQLIITVDNGISCIAGVDHAKALGIKVVVTDHHLPGSQKPNADAIVNPNQIGCTFKSKALAGVGVAFYVMLALRKYLRDQQWFAQQQLAEPNIANLLDLVALGTVADVVALDNNNRILVNQGLKRIRAGKTRPGIQALIEIAGRNQQQLVASDFGFALGPRINAAGRLEDMAYGINCLLATDLMSARVMAKALDDLNKARREIEQDIQQQAEQIFQKLHFDENNLPAAIALYQPDWHQGVIGIVAGRIKEKFNRPTIVFAGVIDDQTGELSDEIKGSARSIVGLHIRDLLEQVSSKNPELVKKFGGHAMAAGLSINHQQFDKFATCFAETAERWLLPEHLMQVIASDGELQADQLNIAFAEIIREAGPWGQNFPEPLFDDYFELVQQRIVGEKHLKCVLAKKGQLFDGIAFNVDITQWPNENVKQVHVAYKLDINEFRGQRNVQLLIEQIYAN